jgi:hypothetical protein
MTDDGASKAGAEFHRSGPWIIIYGHGPESEDRAAELAAQCRARGVDYEMSAIDEAEPYKDHLRWFNALLFVLPSVTGSLRESDLRRIAEFVRAYRATRTEGLSPLLDGSRRWFEVGVIQVFASVLGDELADAEIRSVLHLVDCLHVIKDDETLTPFAAYERASRLSPPTPQPRRSELARSIKELRATLHSWGMEWRLTDVVEARQFIDSMRRAWESNAYSDLRRPVKGAERNRLDFLLDDPNYDPPANECPRKQWMEGGQRVVTRVLDELHERYPNIQRPAHRQGKKGKQEEFQRFYQTLRSAEEVLRIDDKPNA